MPTTHVIWKCDGLTKRTPWAHETPVQNVLHPWFPHNILCGIRNEQVQNRCASFWLNKQCRYFLAHTTPLFFSELIHFVTKGKREHQLSHRIKTEGEVSIYCEPQLLPNSERKQKCAYLDGKNRKKEELPSLVISFLFYFVFPHHCACW